MSHVQKNIPAPVWEDKCWGRVRHIFTSSYAAVSELEINEGWMCSKHWHVHRINQFTVLAGAIAIEEWYLHSEEPKLSVVRAGETLTVPTLVKHRFSVLETGRMIELYWQANLEHPVDIEDIVRDDVGGPCDLKELEVRLKCRNLL